MKAMNVLLDLAYHVGTANNYSSVPAPTAAHPNIPWLYDYAAYHMEEFAHAGITDIVAPPPGKAQGGSGKGCDGYGTFNPFYDLGLTNDQGSRETRFGPFSSLLRMVARAHRFGLRVHFNVVLHQRDGGNNGVYVFSGADGKTKNGRWPLQPECFFGTMAPRRPRDPIMGDVADDFGFGDECVYVNASPKNYMIDGAIDAVDWMTTTLDADGYWVDDPKGLNAGFLYRLLTSKSMADKWAFLEYYDGNPDTLQWAVWNSGLQGRASAMDFTLRWHVQAAANNASNYDMRQLLQGGLNLREPYKAVTFVEDHDTDLSFPCIWNKAMAYFVLMMMPGLPMPFGRDYFIREDCYGLAPIINNQIWCRTFLAQGDFIPRYSSYQIIAWQRTGAGDAPGCIAAVNNQSGSKSNPRDWKQITVQTQWANTRLHDYSINGSDDQWTDHNGMVTFWVPPNENGQGYVCYAPAGMAQPITVDPGTSTTHRLEAAADLGLPLAAAGQTTKIVQLWCDAKYPITIKQLHGNTDLQFAIAGLVADKHGNFIPPVCNAYDLVVTNSGTQTEPYVINVTYMGGGIMPKSELTSGTFAINARSGEGDLKRKQARLRKLEDTYSIPSNNS